MIFQPDARRATDYIARKLQVDPNSLKPNVGSVIVKDGAVVGAVAFHNYFGHSIEISAAIDPGISIRRVWLQDLLDYAFKVADVARLEARTCVTNQPSRRLLRRLGFKEEGRLRHAHDGVLDAVIYSLLPGESRFERG